MLVGQAAHRRQGAALAETRRAAGRAARGGAVRGRPGRVAARRPGRGRRRAGRRDGAVGGGRPLPPPPVRAGAGHGVARRGARPGPARRAARGVARLPPGLDALDDHRATLGSTELRALASARGRRAGPAGAGPRGPRRARGRSCGGASGGGARWPSLRPGRRATGSWPVSWPPCAPTTAGCPRPGTTTSRRACWSASGPGWRRRSSTAGAWSASRTAPGRSVPASTWTGWSTRSATRRSWSCSRSTVGCGRSSSPAAGSGPTPWGAPRTPPRRSTRRGSCCGRRRVAGRSGSPTSGPASRQRCSARPSPRSARDRSSSRRPPRCTRPRGGCCPRWPAYPSRSCPRRRPGCAPGDRELAGTAGCSLPVRGWHRGERRSRWWPRSTRTPWC